MKQITGHKEIELAAALEIARGFDNMGFVRAHPYRPIFVCANKWVCFQVKSVEQIVASYDVVDWAIQSVISNFQESSFYLSHSKLFKALTSSLSVSFCTASSSITITNTQNVQSQIKVSPQNIDIYKAFHEVQTGNVYSHFLISGSKATSKNALINVWEKTFTPTEFAKAGLKLKSSINLLLNIT